MYPVIALTVATVETEGRLPKMECTSQPGDYLARLFGVHVHGAGPSRLTDFSSVINPINDALRLKIRPLNPFLWGILPLSVFLAVFLRQGQWEDGKPQIPLH